MLCIMYIYGMIFRCLIGCFVIVWTLFDVHRVGYWGVNRNVCCLLPVKRTVIMSVVVTI